jgi:diaminopimelate decarboxylase
MEVRNNRLYIGGISARELIEKFKSPLYVYVEETIRRRAEELKNAISYQNKDIKYACKANTNIAVMKILRDEGMGIDAVSPGEIYAAFKAGFTPDQILFTTNNVHWEEIEYAVSQNILVNLDSLSQLKLFGKRYPGKEICMRINPNVGAGHHDHVITGGPESKFGVNYALVSEIKKITRDSGLRVIGIHQHIGSGILDPDMFIRAMDVLLEVCVVFDDLLFIDFGGGLGVPYTEEENRLDIGLLGKNITEDFKAFCGSYGKELKLVIEPGRYFVAESGFLLATVTAVKQGERHKFVGIDTGFNHLMRPAMYGSYHPIVNADNVEGDGVSQTIAGYLCESGDTFTRDQSGIVDRQLPLFREGDIISIGNAGAYGYSMASFYNSRPRPAEVVISGGKAKLVRKRESVEDLFRNSPE